MSIELGLDLSSSGIKFHSLDAATANALLSLQSRFRDRQKVLKGRRHCPLRGVRINKSLLH